MAYARYQTQTTAGNQGISKTVVSGKNGKVTVSFKPTKPGIITVEIQNKKACNTQRIGVVGVFEPPVTG